ncbi:MAG: hypothetical protein J7463_17990 [Roseiflexus sp.]|nr:hypothetical protein [Roseiflexus sp.]
MSTSSNLSDVFSNEAVRVFGAALRQSLQMQEDYASITDFEFAETKEAFADALKRFLRRFNGLARRARREQLRRPDEKSLKEMAQLVDQHGVKVVRAALISHALVKE